MDLLEEFSVRVKGAGGRIVLPEGTEERTLRAARRLADEDLAHPILLGAPDAIAKVAGDTGVSLTGLTQRDPADDPQAEAYAKACADSRERMTQGMAARLMRRPLYFGGMMVAQGDADALVAGLAAPTRRVIEAGQMTVGLAEGIDTPSSFFLMAVPNFLGQGPKAFVYADCGFNVDPSASALADIALAAAASARELLPEPPRVAMLSFSTDGSASHPRVDKVREALGLAQERAPDLLIDGEFQADTALTPAVAAAKLERKSRVAGRANVLVFPDLDSGNIGYKLTQYMAGARAIGPILQGFARPICDLSRGASVDDVVGAAVITLLQAGKGALARKDGAETVR